tara:strand:+ start:185 stop:625 length:441 start_codon:yes stop_codon:yes gene_type:complete
MIPESPLLGALRECKVSWFRPAKVRLSENQMSELTDSENGIFFGCWNGYNGPEWGMERYKTISDLENEHGKALHVKVNWNGKTEGIQFENHYMKFIESKTRHYIDGINDLPTEITQEGRCEGTQKNGERCKRYSPCRIKGHSDWWD